jgi:hypothetical protein
MSHRWKIVPKEEGGLELYEWSRISHHLDIDGGVFRFFNKEHDEVDWRRRAPSAKAGAVFESDEQIKEYIADVLEKEKEQKDKEEATAKFYRENPPYFLD